MRSHESSRPGRDPDTARALEAFARDLLALARGVRVYPQGHPHLQAVADRLLEGARCDLPVPLDLGVLPGELSVGTSYTGDKSPRAAQLAALLHGKKILRLLWTREVTADQAARFARLLTDPALHGQRLRDALPAQGIQTIDLDVLDLLRLHDTFQESSHGEGGAVDARRREAWDWLLQDGVTPRDVAKALTSEAFWGEVGSDGQWDARDAGALGLVLVRLGQRLKDGMEELVPERRSEVEARLARLGSAIRAQDLAVLLRGADREGGLHGAGVSALTRGVGGGRLVELLAAITSVEGRNTRRLADVFRRFAPPGGAAELLPVVRARLESSREGVFAAGIWQAVEEFLLDLQEDPFMGAEYAASLDEIAARGPEAPGVLDQPDLLEDADAHLDRVLISVAAEEPQAWGAALLDRLQARAEQLPAAAHLDLLALVDRAAPGLLDGRPGLLEKVFREGAGRLRDLDGEGRDRLLAFALAHERALLDSVLRTLGEEGRISVRRFLVDVLCAFSPSATPSLVARLRSAPWYVTRNLTIALGRRRELRVIPTLRSLLGHEHPKVRREAVLALARLEAPAARQVLGEVEAGKVGTRAERDLAGRVLAGGA